MTMDRNEQNELEIDVAAYLDGGLGKKEREALVQRLMADGKERDTLALAENAVRDAGGEAEVPERLEHAARGLYPRGPDLFDLVVTLAGKALSVVSAAADTGVVAPAIAGAVRGPQAGAFSHLVASKTFNRAMIDVHIERFAGRNCTFTVKAKDPQRGVPLAASRAELASGWRELASSPLEQGIAQFEDVSPGQYEVIIRKNDTVIGRMSVKIVNN